jgi:Rnl2 family RNA ligase
MEIFKKYFSIENDYQNKVIQNWTNKYPELYKTKYILTEKIDGSNFQIYISKNGEVFFGKRTALLEEDESFFDYKTVIKNNQNVIDSFINYIKDTDYSYIRLYGELFGEGVQKRINYIEGKDILFFDVMIDDNFTTQEFMRNLFKDLNIENKLVPVIAYVNDLETALNYVVEDVSSKVSTFDSKNNIEGVVIKPYNKVFIDGNGDAFYLKRKSEKFKDQMDVKTVKKEVVYSDNFNRVFEIYMSYINDNRIADVMGKYGEISNPSQIGDYIKYVIEDVKRDFFKNNMDDFNSLDDSEKGKLIGMSGEFIVPLLKKYL